MYVIYFHFLFLAYVQEVKAFMVECSLMNFTLVLDLNIGVWSHVLVLALPIQMQANFLLHWIVVIGLTKSILFLAK